MNHETKCLNPVHDHGSKCSIPKRNVQLSVEI